ncbi:PHP domain-containing protein [Flindersiella endophytica]
MSLVLIDLHTHSNCSDGTDTPAELVAKADAAGLAVVALTDHDTFAGWGEAAAEAEQRPIGLLLGVEMSCKLRGTGVHLLGYQPDPTEPELAAELERIRAGRAGRVPMIVDTLRRHGVEITVEDVYAHVGDAPSPGRPHVADALVAKGYAANRAEAFEVWLSEGRPGNLTRYAPDPALAIRLVVAAGGAPVIAHPHGRSARRLLTDEAFADLAAAGLAGIEVDHLDHDPATRAHLRDVAKDLDLVMTGSSDYHGKGKQLHPLGVETTDPQQFERLLQRIKANAAASGRTPPEPLL